MSDAASNRPANRRIVLNNYVKGEVTPDIFRVEEVPVQEPAEGEVLIATDTLSIDAFMRTALNEWEGLHQQTAIGGVVGALGVGRIVESAAEGFEKGDAVFGPLASQSYTTLPAAALQKIDDALPLSTYLGALGLTTGVTAYFGIRRVAQVKKGDTVVVSAAAGAVGSIAGQIARLDGAEKVIGIAGGPEKCAFLTSELGFTDAIDYRNEDVGARLKEIAPDGVDAFFDNVGGEILDAVLDNIRDRARVAICGAISQYDDQLNVRGPSLYLRLAERYSRMEGFTVMHFAEEYPEAYAQLGAWLASGELKMAEQVEEGIDSFATALIKLLQGGNTGKMLLKVGAA